jgi:hypothetical protein
MIGGGAGSITTVHFDSETIMPLHSRRTGLIGSALRIISAGACAALLGLGARSALGQMPSMPNINEMLKRLAPGMGTMPSVPPPGQMPNRPDRSAVDQGPKPPGVPVPRDSPLFAAFARLEQQAAYRVRVTPVSDDPEYKRMMASGMGIGTTEIAVVRPDTRQVTMHMRMPATDIPDTIDDWEIRAVARNGRAARLITSPAVPRYMKLGEEKLAEQMMMLDMQASAAVTQSLTEGPLGMAHAGYIAGMTAMAHLQAIHLQQKAKDFFSWQCVAPEKADTEAADRNAPTPLTDLKVLGDGSVDGTPVTTYEFYVKDGDAFHGPMRLSVAKATGLPLRVELRESGNGMRMEYYDIGKPAAIDVPSCLAARN